MNPVRFLRTALQYMMIQNRAEEPEPSVYRYDMFVFVQDDDQSSIHTHFSEEVLQGERSVITRDNIGLGTVVLDRTLEYISDCRWIVPVLTSNFLSDRECVDFIHRVQFNRPHALIPIVWEQPPDVRNVSIEHLLRTGEPLYWPGDLAAPEDKRNFWSALLERTIPR